MSRASVATGRSAGRPASGEDGRIMLLTAGVVALALMIVAMVASATAVHLDRAHLYDLADVLAADAADASPSERFYAGSSGTSGASAAVSLTDADVEGSVRGYLESHPQTADGLTELQVAEATSPDGRTARVTLSATSRPALVRWFSGTLGGFEISASSSARAG